jgi:hypothetical protein
MDSPVTATDHARSFVVTAVAVALVAGPIGVLWAHVVPHAGYILDANGFALPVGGEGEFMRADGWFLFMCLIVGALTGVAAWWLTAGRSVAAVVGLAVGGVFASFAVARIGQQQNTGRLHIAAEAKRIGYSPPFHGHYPPLAHGELFVWAFAAVLIYAVLGAVFARRTDQFGEGDVRVASGDGTAESTRSR